MHRIAQLACAAVGPLLLVPGITSGQPHPRQYVRVYEVRDSSSIPSGETLGRVMDRRNNVLIHFDQDALRAALIGQTRTNAVRIRVEGPASSEGTVRHSRSRSTTSSPLPKRPGPKTPRRRSTSCTTTNESMSTGPTKA